MFKLLSILLLLVINATTMSIPDKINDNYFSARNCSNPRFPLMCESVFKLNITDSGEVVHCFYFKDRVLYEDYAEVREFMAYTSINVLFWDPIMLFTNCREYAKGKVYHISETRFSDLNYKDVMALLSNYRTEKEGHAFSTKEFNYEMDRNPFINKVFGFALTENQDIDYSMKIIKVNFFPSMAWLRRAVSNSQFIMLPNFKVVMPMHTKISKFTHLERVNMMEQMSMKNVPSEMTFKLVHYAYDPSNLQNIIFMKEQMYDPTVLMKLFKTKRIEFERFGEEEVRSVALSIATGSMVRISSSRDVELYRYARHGLVNHAIMEFISIKPEYQSFKGDMKTSEVFGRPDLIGKELTPDIIVCKETSSDWMETRAAIAKLFDVDLGEDGILYLEIKVPDSFRSIGPMEAAMNYLSFAELMSNTLARPATSKIFSFPLDTAEEALTNFTENEQVYNKLNMLVNIHRLSVMKTEAYQMYSKEVIQTEEVVDYERVFDYLFCDMEYMSMMEAFKMDNVMKDKMTKVSNEDDMVMKEVKQYKMSEEEYKEYVQELVKKVVTNMSDEKSTWMKKYFKMMEMNKDVTNLISKQEDQLFNRKGAKEIDSTKAAFKFPFMEMDTSSDKSKFAATMRVYSEFNDSKFALDDGTFFGNTFGSTIEGVDDYPDYTNTGLELAGMKLSHVDSDLFEAEMVNLLTDPCSDKFNEVVTPLVDMFSEEVPKNMFEKILKSKMFETLYMTKLMMFDLIQVQARRLIIKEKVTENPKDRMGRAKWKTMSKYSVFKSFEKYTIEVKKGSKMTAGKQIRYKIWVEDGYVPSNTLFHKFYKSKVPGFYCTKYLTISSTDSEHFCMMFDKAVYLAASLLKKLDNGRYTIKTGAYEMAEVYKMLIGRLAMLMDHRRTTSSAVEVNRYMIIGASSLIQDKTKLVKKVGEAPIRSRAHNYYVSKQIKWIKHSGVNFYEKLSKIMQDTTDTSTTYYDYFELKSVYSEMEVDMDVMLDEMYIYALTSKEQGEMGHMTEATIEKMAEDELAFRKQLDMAEIRENMLGMMTLDSPRFNADNLDYFEFSREAVTCGTKMAMKPVPLEAVYQDFLNYVFEPMVNLATMKSSVYTAERNTAYSMEFGKKEKRAKAMKTQSRLMNSFLVFYLIEGVNAFSKWDIYFAEFPKKQLAKAREIMIQDIFTRPKVRLHEKFFECLIKYMPYDMLTKKNDKFFKQANAFSDMMVDLTIRTKNSASNFLKFACNRDHSHWAPSTNCLYYMYMIRAMELPKMLEDYLLTCCAAFMHKAIGAPETVKRKLKAEKDRIQHEDKEEPSLDEKLKNKPDHVKWYYEDMRRRDMMFITFYSGFGQGMLHNTSSMYHNACKTLTNQIFKYAVEGAVNKVAITSLVSSDDNTDLVLVAVEEEETAMAILATYTVVNWMHQKLFNLIENMYKTSEHMVISEFNSNYLMFKRTLMPVIKFVYSSFAIPDSTCPEDAVREMIAMEMRLLENGADLELLTIARYLHRESMHLMYKNKNIGAQIRIRMTYSSDMEDFEKEAEELFELGKMPMTYIFESIVYGPDIYMFKSRHPLIKKFRNNLMLVNPDESYFNLRNRSIYSEDMIYKKALVLPTALNKRLEEFKKDMDFSSDLFERTKDTRLDLMVDPFMNPNDVRYLINNKIGSLALRYDLDPTIMYKVESVIRANALMSERREISVSTNLSIKTAVDFFLSNVDKDPNFNMLDTHPMAGFYSQLMTMSENIQNKIKNEAVRVMGRHAKMRTITYQDIAEYPNISVKAALDILMSNKGNLSKRHQMRLNLIEKYYKLTGEFSVKPLFDKLKKNNRLVATNIMTIIRNMSKITEAKSMFMPFEAPNALSFRVNWINLYRFRTNTSFIYMPSEAFYSEFTTVVTDYEDFTKDIRTIPMFTSKTEEVITMMKMHYMKKMISVPDVVLRDDFSNSEYITKLTSILETPNMTVLDLQMELMKRVYYGVKEFKNRRDGIVRAQMWVYNYTFMILQINDRKKKFNLAMASILAPKSGKRKAQEMDIGPCIKFISMDVKELMNRQYTADNSVLLTEVFKGKEATLNFGDFNINVYSPPICDINIDEEIFMNKKKTSWGVSFSLDITTDPKKERKMTFRRINLFKTTFEKVMTESMKKTVSEVVASGYSPKISDTMMRKMKVFSLSTMEIARMEMEQINEVAEVLEATSKGRGTEMAAEEEEEFDEEEYYRRMIENAEGEDPEESLLKGMATLTGEKVLSVMEEITANMVGAMTMSEEMVELFSSLGKSILDAMLMKKENLITLITQEMEAAQRSMIIDAIIEKVLRMYDIEMTHILTEFNSMKLRIKRALRVSQFVKENADDVVTSKILTDFEERNERTREQWKEYEESKLKGVMSPEELEAYKPAFNIMSAELLTLFLREVSNKLSRTNIFERGKYRDLSKSYPLPGGIIKFQDPLDFA